MQMDLEHTEEMLPEVLSVENMVKDLLTVDEVAKLLCVCRNTIYNWIKTNDFPCPIAMGRLTRFRRAEVMEWLNSRNARYQREFPLSHQTKLERGGKRK